MKKTFGVLALSLSSVLALSLLAGCGGGAEKQVAARICYDNLPDDGIALAAEDTTFAIQDVESVTAVDAAGQAVADSSAIATYDAANGLLTAVSEGTVTLHLKGGETFRVEVVPAYATDPGYQYANKASDYSQGGNLLGGTHDPSLIEVEEDGKPVYYIFSTGWGFGNEIRRSEDLVKWTYMGKSMSADTKIPAIEAWLEGENDGTHISWWAPDIVPAADGGYWLYTCAVSAGATDDEGYRQQDDGISYSKACIVLFYSSSLEEESFRYKGVLMQSCIPKGSSGSIDINSIDPQIIYSPDGKMYMAYGSFGTGNWMLELNPKTGLRKDGTYKDGKFFDYETVRKNRDDAVEIYSDFKEGTDIETDYYGTMISQAAMEAPVIARHDHVTVSDENGVLKDESGKELTDKTYYYSMHSYNGLGIAYQMWGGRSENPMGRYTTYGGAPVFNNGYGSGRNFNSGNKYMGSFTWSYKAPGVFEPDIILPGHNDLFTTKDQTNIAAYITRTDTYNQKDATGAANYVFMVQLHQYYLNSLGDICINPNRFGGEISRTVTADELFRYTDGGKFQMVALENGEHNGIASSKSFDVVLTRNGNESNGKISRDGAEIGSWLMYGKGYIKFTFSKMLENQEKTGNTEETVYYGVVRPSWLNDQNKSGFTITCLGHSNETRSMAMFMNNYSTLTVK